MEENIIENIEDKVQIELNKFLDSHDWSFEMKTAARYTANAIVGFIEKEFKK